MKKLKVSAKMQYSIDRLEQKYGKLEKTFGSEKTPYNKDFYCWCELRSRILQSLARTVLHNGEIHNI